MWFFETSVTHLLDRNYQNRCWVDITGIWYTFSYFRALVSMTLLSIWWSWFSKRVDLNFFKIKSISKFFFFFFFWDKTLGFVWLGDRKLWGNKMGRGWKNWIFFSYCLVGGVEKWNNKKLFCLVEKKNNKIKNVNYINLLSCS